MEREMDQFLVLEQKIDALIEYIKRLKEENESMREKIRVQEDRITDLNSEIEKLRTERNQVGQRIMSILEKMEKIEL